MLLTTEEMITKMSLSLSSWLESQNYNYIESNHVPRSLFTRYHKINVIIRAFFRLCPYNLRNMKRPASGLFPLTPQSNVTLLRAYLLAGNEEIINLLYKRVLSLQSSKTKYFSLRQGIKISVNLYENSPDDPSPLNTVWFGQFLLDEDLGIISESERRSLLFSISNYLIEELGYADHYEHGVYFYYGPTLKKEIYNASAVISAFLIKVGIRYKDERILKLGQRGIQFIVYRQNGDGSWFSIGKPERPTIDCFHHSYILQSLYSVMGYLPFEIKESIRKGIDYYRKLFVKEKDYIRPVRYDKRYTPHNTWLFQKVDGRDVAEGLIFFSQYSYDKDMVDALIYYLYNKFYNKWRGYFASEILIFGKNKIPYIEFQAWFLYALEISKLYKNMSR